MTGSYEHWSAASCQVRGSYHARCQDRAAAWTSPRPALCVLDGRGSAALSHIGARQATRTLQKFIEQAEPELHQMLDYPMSATGLQGFFHNLYRAAVRVQWMLSIRFCRPVEDFEFTLSVTILGRHHVAWLVVGDSPLLASYHGITGLLAAPEITEYANETTFVSARLPPAVWRCGRLSADGLESILAMSDGAAARLLELPGHTPSSAVHQILERVVTRQWSSSDLRHALQDATWDLVTGDDRSLAMLTTNPTPPPNTCPETYILRNSPTMWSAHSIARACAAVSP